MEDAAARKRPMLLLLPTSLLLCLVCGSSAQSYIGVNYGEVADNLPSPEATVALLKSTSISKVRLYGVDTGMLRALAGSGISVVVGVANGDIPGLAADPAAASRWLATNVLPFVPATTISTVAVGNEVLESGDAALSAALLPAMQNLRAAALAASGAASAAAAAIRFSTVNTMAVLAQSDPPSSGAFHPDVAPQLQQILAFLSRTGAPFMVNPYPWFAYRADPRPDTLAFCLFQPDASAARVDAGSGVRYTNMFDAQLDAVRAALTRAGFGGVDVVVAETGWPTQGEPGATVENARAYVSNLVAHLRSGAGTPLAPGKTVDTYLFAMYDEDLKPGPPSERAFGLFHTDLSMAYDAGLSLSSSSSSGSPSGGGGGGAGASQPKGNGGWCVASAAATEAELQADLDYACAQVGVDCAAIQPGGACFEPNTVRAHAAYAMNQLYQAAGRNPWNCDFRQSATLTSQNPSYGSCVYTGGQ